MGRERGPFATHLWEAILLNQARLPLYAKVSDGASVPISRRLIRAERLALPVAGWLDRAAQPLERRGIPVFSEVFVSMRGTPEFHPFVEPGPQPPLLTPRDARQIAAMVTGAARANGWTGAMGALDGWLARLPGGGGFGCMVRHLLESALRVAVLAPRHAERAQRAGLALPTNMHRRLFRLHLIALGQAAALDRRAAPLQARGVPILCRDVPPLPRP